MFDWFHRDKFNDDEEWYAAREQKEKERKMLLDKYPDLRRRVQTEKLKEIVDYEYFKCVWGSSVAKDLAIEGSDIDGGVVVTDREVSEEERLAFVLELRNQGFSAYDITEAREAKRAVDQAVKNEIEQFDLYELFSKKVNTDLGVIHFYTQGEIDQFTRKGFPEPVIKAVITSGFEIR